MILILKILYHEIVKVEASFYRDPRTAHLPMVGPPWCMLTVLALYLLFVKKWGPSWMAKRKRFDVRLPMLAYNLLQVLLNCYAFYGALRYSYMQPYFSTSCQEYDTQDTRPSLVSLIVPAYVYYISKYLDLLDTIFFVLRKKQTQITFLHVYHHTAMVYGVWAYLTLVFGSHYTATGVVNAFIHICMYSYYFVAALQLQVDLTPWKRRLTQLQILQFLYLTIHFVQPLINNWCRLDLFWSWVAFLQNLFMLVLFLDFYYAAYIRKSRSVKPAVAIAEEPTECQELKDN